MALFQLLTVLEATANTRDVPEIVLHRMFIPACMTVHQLPLYREGVWEERIVAVFGRCAYDAPRSYSLAWACFPSKEPC
jgi:hypothetical protein